MSLLFIQASVFAHSRSRPHLIVLATFQKRIVKFLSIKLRTNQCRERTALQKRSRPAAIRNCCLREVVDRSGWIVVWTDPFFSDGVNIAREKGSVSISFSRYCWRVNCTLLTVGILPIFDSYLRSLLRARLLVVANLQQLLLSSLLEIWMCSSCATGVNCVLILRLQLFFLLEFQRLHFISFRMHACVSSFYCDTARRKTTIVNMFGPRIASANPGGPLIAYA